MSDKKGPFDAAIDAIRGWQRVIEVYSEMHIEEIANLEEAVHVLLDWPKWEPLIEAAGKVDGRRAIRTLATLLQVYVEAEGRLIPELEEALRGGAVIEIRALLESLPEK